MSVKRRQSEAFSEIIRCLGNLNRKNQLMMVVCFHRSSTAELPNVSRGQKYLSIKLCLNLSSD
ncbi:uncharacterized protein BKA55DRAFT_641408 [Fusarium redolens]|uniref:Uncharacterized protein n=1 Tax=Fusarium redolens TaxID=48865 RepID=A0A9P9HF81_FUSRE|nr:uncharacterized protein BKA55DRAFT_641408 [Fusarium redolens]KAH7255848.1 hypothetical protein BKA55DRAFT_641408 [Fusarium redolens]